MKGHQIKAAEVLMESLKLLVTLSTVFFGGLLAYRTGLDFPVAMWSYYISISLLVASAILSVVNIKALINKIHRDDADAIKRSDVKLLNVLASLSLLAGIGAGAYFLSANTHRKAKPSTPESTHISDSSISIGTNLNVSVEVKKDSSGKIQMVTISPPEVTDRRLNCYTPEHIP